MKVGFGCGCGHTNLLKSNRPLGGTPFADLVKNNIIGEARNHVGAADILGVSRTGGPGMLEVGKSINAKNLLKLFR